MILVALSYIVVFLEMLIGLVIVGKDIIAMEITFDSEMIVGNIGESALAVGRFNDCLGKGNGCRYSISSHLYLCQL